MSGKSFLGRLPRLFLNRHVLVALPVLLTLGVLALSAPPGGIARAGQGEPAPVRRPLPPGMLEAYAEGEVVALAYLQTYYCPTTPSSDLEPPFGQGDGHPQSEDPSEYNTVPPCFFGDTGTGSILPAELRAGAFPGVKTFYAMAPFFGTALGTANSPGDVETHCSEPGPPITHRRGEPGTCLMHPSTLRFARIFEDPSKQPPDPVPTPQHSHIVPERSSPPAWWNLRGVAIYDRSIWPDHDGSCPAGPPRCVTSVAALRGAQKTGQASIDVPSNAYFYLSIHREAR